MSQTQSEAKKKQFYISIKYSAQQKPKNIHHKQYTDIQQFANNSIPQHDIMIDSFLQQQ